MGVNTYLLLCLAFATRLRIAHAEIDKECIYEGQRFTLDRAGQLPLETHRNFDFGECKDLCDSKPTCIIFQWQPTKKICWLMNVKPYLDGNSDFGIGHCEKGKPIEIGNGPQCEITKGDRINVWKDHRYMTKEECMAICEDNSDCLIWQHIRNKKLCRIHKLKVDTTKQSQVGIHYCRSTWMKEYMESTPSCGVSNRQLNPPLLITCGLPRFPGNLIGSNAVRFCPGFDRKHLILPGGLYTPINGWTTLPDYRDAVLVTMDRLLRGHRTTKNTVFVSPTGIFRHYLVSRVNGHGEEENLLATIGEVVQYDVHVKLFPKGGFEITHWSNPLGMENGQPEKMAIVTEACSNEMTPYTEHLITPIQKQINGQWGLVELDPKHVVRQYHPLDAEKNAPWWSHIGF